MIRAGPEPWIAPHAVIRSNPWSNVCTRVDRSNSWRSGRVGAETRSESSLGMIATTHDLVSGRRGPTAQAYADLLRNSRHDTPTEQHSVQRAAGVIKASLVLAGDGRSAKPRMAWQVWSAREA